MLSLPKSLSGFSQCIGISRLLGSKGNSYSPYLNLHPLFYPQENTQIWPNSRRLIGQLLLRVESLYLQMYVSTCACFSMLLFLQKEEWMELLGLLSKTHTYTHTQTRWWGQTGFPGILSLLSWAIPCMSWIVYLRQLGLQGIIWESW